MSRRATAYHSRPLGAISAQPTSQPMNCCRRTADFSQLRFVSASAQSNFSQSALLGGPRCKDFLLQHPNRGNGKEESTPQNNKKDAKTARHVGSRFRARNRSYVRPIHHQTGRPKNGRVKTCHKWTSTERRSGEATAPPVSSEERRQ
jgi:hypothetical protein